MKWFEREKIQGDGKLCLTPFIFLRCLFAGIMLFSLTACATGGSMFHHSFSFDTRIDSPEIEVLDYQYGGSGIAGTYAHKGRVSRGETFRSAGVYALQPRGEFLYVKWRLKSNGQVFEDRVDLSKRLPTDMEKLELHFVIRGSQLYVFINYPWDGQTWENEPLKNKYVPVQGGIKRFHGSKQVQVYPDPEPVPASTW